MIAYVLLGMAIGIGVMLVAILIYKKIIIGYTEEAEPIYDEGSIHEIEIIRVYRVKKETKEKWEWYIVSNKWVRYTLPRSTEIIRIKDKEGKMLLKRIFLTPCVIRKRWFHKDKEEKLPMELHQFLYVREEEIQDYL